MQELARRRTYGTGITVEEVLATRGEADNPLPLPPLEELAPYSVATGERAEAGAPITVRLWMSERDAEAYLARRQQDGALAAGAIFSVLPPKKDG